MDKKTDIPASNFLEMADTDYLASRFLFYCGNIFHSLAAYHSQQAIEKYIKAYTVQESETYIATHNLEKLREKASSFNTYFNDPQVITKIGIFNVFDQVTRYGAESTFDPLKKKEPEIEIRGMWMFGGKNIVILDELVFKIRGLMDLKKIRYSDPFSAILEERKDHYFTATWQLGLPLKVILTHANSFFK